MLSRKTKYGLEAILHLARHAGQGHILISELARAERIPKKFLEAILLELKKKGLLDSKKGKGGGYFLRRPPGEIMMGEVIRILEGPLAPVSCVSRTAYRKCDDCQHDDVCGIRIVMKDVRDAMAKILDHTSLADVVRRMDEQKSVVDFVI